MQQRLILHIGTHKTGSTSLQRYLLDHARKLRRSGIHLYNGQFHAANHVELYLAAMRYERDSFAKRRLGSRVRFDEGFTRQVANRLHVARRSCRQPCILFSCEGLSLLRHDDEIDRLIRILDAAHENVKVVLYLRNKADFLRSYSRQLLGVHGRAPVNDYWSALYVEPDTWLTDYDSLISAYRRGFGVESVTVIDYDAEMQREGNVIPSFLRTLGIDASRTRLSRYFLNASRDSDKRDQTGGLFQRVKLGWQKLTRRRAA